MHPLRIACRFTKIFRKGTGLRGVLLFFLAVLAISSVPVLSAQSTPFNGPRDYIVGAGPQSVVVADFNGDGRPEIATANYESNNISILLQNSDGTFQAAVTTQ
ncbi:MAG: VCBS repeat-containing protein [Candidatus Sulfotelmatobacter sp.]